MPLIANTTISSSIPSMVVDGLASGMPRVFVMRSTAVSSAIVATGFLAGMGDGGRNANPGLRLFDLVVAIQTTDTAYPGRVTLHSVISATANVASTVASSGWNAAYDVSLNNSTST